MSFGDIRVAKRADWLIDRIVATGSLVLRKIGETRAGEVAVHRFLSSPYVSVENIVETLAGRTATQGKGRRLLTVQDTTEINFAGRDKKRRDFGPGANGKDRGFFIHPVIAIDVETEAVLGLVDAAIWTRAQERVAARRSRTIEQKESGRWLAGCEAAAQSLREAASVTMVADRESDIYLLFARKPVGLNLIVRAAQDRKLADGGRLFGALADTAPLTVTSVKVAPRGPGDKGRIAKVALRAGRALIARPDTGDLDDAPETIELTLVEASEIDAPAGKTALLCGFSPPIRSAPPRKPNRSCSFIVCAGALSRSSVRSKATVSRSTTVNSSTPNACSISLP